MPTSIGSTTFPTGSAATSLMSKLSGFNSTPFNSSGLDVTSHKPRDRALAVREKFQDFAAGTFYKEMLKSLRSGQKHSKYFYGGQAEEIFRGQFDQQIAEDLAHQYGGPFANPLFEAYSRQVGMQSAGSAQSGSTQMGPSTAPASFSTSPRMTAQSPTGGAHALDVVA